MDPIVALAGLFVGFVVGLTGMGGGALMTPILVLLFKIEPLAAVSSDIVASMIMKPIGGSVHFRRGSVNKELVAANKLSGDARYKTYGNLDVQITSKYAPWASYDNRNEREFVSKRTGGYLFQPANASADLNTFFLK